MNTRALKRELAILCDPASGRARRALAAATVSAAFNPDLTSDVVPASPELSDAHARMYGFAMRHPQAPVWDGRSTRSGTITYVDDEWIEQYVGQQRWLAYRQSDLSEPGFVLGDQVRIAVRNGGVAIEAIGTNRLPREARWPSRTIRSGVTIVQRVACSGDRLLAAAQTSAVRYAAELTQDSACIVLTCRNGARLRVEPLSVAAVAPGMASLLAEPPAGALRLEVSVDAENAAAALEVESALIYCAALVASAVESVTVDDSGAVFSTEQIVDLARRDETRGAAFPLAAAAAQRTWPVDPRWLSDRSGVCDELVLFSSRAWRADFASEFVKRVLESLSDALQRSDDDVIPREGVLYGDDERTPAGTLQKLATLSYDTTDIDIAFLDSDAAGDHAAAELLATREDIAALLGEPIAGAVVIAFGNRTADTESEVFGLDMRRADVIATAIGAALARRGSCIGSDVNGTLYSAEELIDLAVRRCGKSAAPVARVVAANEPATIYSTC